MNTTRGTKLLTSGWWGRSRHPNYLFVFRSSGPLAFADIIFSGDLLMALAWSLATGFNTPITYFYPVYFFVLLIHRQLRDDEMCEVK